MKTRKGRKFARSRAEAFSLISPHPMFAAVCFHFLWVCSTFVHRSRRGKSNFLRRFFIAHAGWRMNLFFKDFYLGDFREALNRDFSFFYWFFYLTLVTWLIRICTLSVRGVISSHQCVGPINYPIWKIDLHCIPNRCRSERTYIWFSLCKESHIRLSNPSKAEQQLWADAAQINPCKYVRRFFREIV